MNHRFLASMSALGVVTVLVLPTPILIAGQAPSSMAKTRTPPRTPDGKPDLQGIWTNATVTPLERPRDLAGKEFLTETEAAEFEKQAVYDANGDRRDGTADADVAHPHQGDHGGWRALPRAQRPIPHLGDGRQCLRTARPGRF